MFSLQRRGTFSHAILVKVKIALIEKTEHLISKQTRVLKYQYSSIKIYITHMITYKGKKFSSNLVMNFQLLVIL